LYSKLTKSVRGSLNFDFRNTFANHIWWAILTKPPTSKIRLIKISPHQNIALFNHDFMVGHTYQTANRLKSRGSVYKGSAYAGSAYAGSVYRGSMYGGSARRSARCPTRRSALKTLHMEALRMEVLCTKTLRMEALYIKALHKALHNVLYDTLH
jgi:hypothetical protein